MECGRTRLEKEKQAGGCCSNLEEVIVAQARGSRAWKWGDGDALENSSCWEEGLAEVVTESRGN